MELFFDGLNTADKRYLKRKKEIICKLEGKDTTNIGMITSASKYVSIKFVDQFILIINHKEILNGIKDTTKMKKIESLFKYQ